MAVTQVRLPDGLIKEVDKLINKGVYTSKSDVVRDALRKLVLERQIGSIPNTGNSVKEIRKARKRLSKQIKSFKNIETINKLR